MRKSYLIAFIALGAGVLVLYAVVTNSLTGQTGKRPDRKKEAPGQVDAKDEKQPTGQPNTKDPQDKPKRDWKGWPPRGGKTPPKAEIARGPFALKFRRGQVKFDGALDSEDEEYRSKKNAKVFLLHFESGKTYQIDHKSNAFDAYLYLENPEGEVVARDDDSGGGLNARIVYEAATTGTYRVIATNLGQLRPGPSPFSLLIKLISGSGPGVAPKGIPAWFNELDTNEDGQVSLAEWRLGGKKLEEFREYDLNDDGFITTDEMVRFSNQPLSLKRDNGQMKFNHTIETTTEEPYRGKRAFKSYPIQMERGKTYQIECVSKEFWAFLYLEDPEGELLAEHNSGGNDKVSRIVHVATKSGTYRLIATSLGGFRGGEFSFSVRVLPTAGPASLPKGVPAWFRDLDKDGDAQVSLSEWRMAGKKLDQFEEYDLNDDGFITPDEVLRQMAKPVELPSTGTMAFNHSLMETPDNLHRGKKSYKIYNVKLVQGRTYEFHLTSKEFQSFLYLENAEGNVVEENSSPTVGGNSRITFTATRTATYHLVATSQGGFRVGDYALSIRVTN